ncbi:MAG: hypothetical protein QM619_12315 [Micropruina sp.]|uniref:hypothetical protein n=1 Tax=Micropruina sp. TaxID=2737536 RepID=UPI0039E696B3
MPPLCLAAVGLLLVLVEIRLGSVLLSLDLVGWVMAAMGMNQLIDVDRWFVWARNMAITALVLELIQFISPVAVLTVLVALGLRLVVLAFVYCLCTALLQRLGSRDRGYGVVLQVLRLAIPLVTLMGAVFVVIPAPAVIPVGWLYPIQLACTVVLAGVMWALGSRYTFTR